MPVAVLVNRQSASASEIVTGALQDRKRATVVGTRTFGKGVFQEIEQLSNGGALDITVGEYFLPSGRNIGGGGVAKGDGIAPDVKAVDNPKTKPRRGPGRGGRRGPARRHVKHRQGGGHDERASGGPVVAVLERRGRFLTAEPFFDRGRRMSLERPRPGSAARAGRPAARRPERPALADTRSSCAGSGARTSRAT